MSSLFNIGAGGETGFYPYKIENSLRFDDGSTANLSKTLGSGGNRKTWTFSAWVKRSDLTSTFPNLFSSFVNTQNYGLIRFDTSGRLGFVSKISDSNGLNFSTNHQHRDVSAWYHFVIAVDTTQSTSTDRVKFYVNGTQVTTFYTASYPSQNYSTIFNYNITHYIGRYGGATSGNFDGYMAQVQLVDGSQLTPSSFGEFKSGIWIPKDTSGLTFGTNGFRLEFGDSSAIGDDTSGNENDWTATNFSVHDVMPDSPTNSFATLLDRNLDDYTLSEGNLRATSAGAQLGYATSTHEVNHAFGKFYYETRSNSTGNGTGIGLVKSSVGGTRAYPLAQTGSIYYTAASGAIFSTITGATEVSAATYTDGDVIGIAVDGENGTAEFFKNGVSQGTVTEATIATEGYVAYMLNASTSGSSDQRINFGADSTFAGLETAATNADGNGIGEFHHSVPSGFLALCTENFSEPAVSPKNSQEAEDYFDVILWEGTGSSQSITGLNFSPDFVWLKNREHSDWNNLLDTVRTNSSRMSTNNTNAEDDGSGIITSFDSNGFSVGSNSNSNRSGDGFVAWNWFAGTAFSNDASATGVGTIDSSGQTNTTAGFSIVSHTGTGSAGTIAHNLGKKPAMIMTKLRSDSGQGWLVYHHGLNKGVTPEQKYIVVSSSSDQGDLTTIWNDTAPTTSVFSVGTSTAVNGNTETYISYVWAELDGYSKFGFYEGNGSTNGSYIWTGFSPSFIMLKRYDSSGDWFIFDNMRDGYNPENMRIRANDSGAEADPGTFEILSNGFKIGFTSANANASGADYIYMAFADMPFKYATAKAGHDANT